MSWVRIPSPAPTTMVTYMVTHEIKWNKEKSNSKSKFNSSSAGNSQSTNDGIDRGRNSKMRIAILRNNWIDFTRHQTRNIRRCCTTVYGRTTALVRCAALKAVWLRNGFGGSNPSSTAMADWQSGLLRLPAKKFVEKSARRFESYICRHWSLSIEAVH